MTQARVGPGKATSPEQQNGEMLDSHLAAVLFADIAGYSTAMNRNEVATANAVQGTLEALAEEVRIFGGATLNFMGDGILAIFDSVANAIMFALTFQRRLVGSPILVSGEALQARVGIHMGEIFLAHRNAHGDALNVAERIQSSAPAGSVCISDVAYRAVRMRSEFGFECLGEKDMKGFSEPISIYRVHDSNQAGATQMASRRGAPPSRLQSLFERKPADEARPSVAILPFRDQSDGTGESYFADGVTDDIITSLSRFRGIDVIARGSSSQFRNRTESLAEIGRQLNSRYIAHGTIRCSSKRVRASVELADAFTGRTVWAERYDRPFEDIFEIQDEITELTVGALTSRIEAAEGARFKVQSPESLDAYGLVLRGSGLILNYSAQDNALARRHFEDALRIEPGYGRALAGISRTHSLDWRYHWSHDPEASLRAATAFAMSAVEADPNDARGFGELGYVQLYLKDHDRSIASYERAVRLNPNDANILMDMGDALAHAGRAQEAVELFRKAMRLNPFYPDDFLWALAGAYTKLRRFEEAIDCVLHMCNPTQGRRILACCYAHLGRLEEARREADLIRKAHPGFTAEGWAKILPDRRPEDAELFISGMKLAGL